MTCDSSLTTYEYTYIIRDPEFYYSTRVSFAGGNGRLSAAISGGGNRNARAVEVQ